MMLVAEGLFSRSPRASCGLAGYLTILEVLQFEMPVARKRGPNRPCQKWRGSMAGMDPDGYWYRYFAARHDIILKIGLVVLGIVLISVLTGKTLVKGRGIVSETSDPKTFWGNVIILLVLGAACIGLWAFGPS
jgi:hypothetical protein